jgi:tripartite-type tricarboxylate transporter receptor subunit TctC
MLAHLLAEQVQAATRIRWTHVAYRGGAPAVNDLLTGVLQCGAINVTPSPIMCAPAAHAGCSSPRASASPCYGK